MDNIKFMRKWIFCILAGILLITNIGFADASEITEENNLDMRYNCCNVITKNGDLYSWGRNISGQIGCGTMVKQLTPTKILSDVVSVSMGTNVSSAITGTGDLYCWGWNLHGEVGNGTKEEQLTPTKVLSDVVSVSMRTNVSSAITKNGDLYCWGWNNLGQIGNGTREEQLTPVKVLNNVAFTFVEEIHCSAITTSGDLYCWGWNYCGQIGNGTKEDQLTPTKVLSDVVSVSMGTNVSSAITRTGDLYCWGWNEHGKVGDETTKEQLTPTKVLSNVVSVSMGDYHSSAITRNGDLYCWGLNSYGEIGNGTKEAQLIPKKILSDVTLSSMGTWCSSAITRNGDLYCWGWNSEGQVGNGTTEDQLTPQKIMNLCKGENEGNNEPPISKNTVAYFRKISKDVEVREEFTFDYSLDSCLENSATEYNPDLACMLSALAASAYQKDTITDSLRNLGFKTETKDFYHYDENYTDDKTAFALVTKNMEDGTTLISVIIRGSYGDILDFTGDWKSNANFKNVGKGLHEGFAAAAKDISEELDKFKNDKSINSDNVKYVITGHSRGAAVANLVAKKLVDDGESKDRVYDYNFACPDSGRDYPGNWNPSGAYDNLFNINNVRDIVGVIPGNLFNKSLNINSFFFKDQLGILFWGKYGRTYFFAERWDRVQETMIGGLDQHESTLYFDHMKEKQSTNSFKSWEQARATLVKNNLLGKYFENGKIYGLFCPVNMEVIDSSGIKVAEVVDGQVKYYTDSFGDVVIITAGDQSLVYVNGSKNYFIKLTGSDTGKMTYCVSDAVFEEYGKEITYSDVPLTEGKTYVSKIDNNVLSDAVTLVLLDENFNPVKQIMGDGTEKELSPELKEDYADLPFAKTEYSIKYNLDGGEVTGNPVTYSKATATFTLKNPVKPGYTFIGWTGSNGHSPQLTVSIRQGTTGNLSYTANWQRNLQGMDDPGNGGDSLGPNEGFPFRKAIAKGTCLIADKNLYYTGNPIMPQIIVSFDGKDLIKDIDYTVFYDNNVNIGNAKVIIDGIGEFRGRKIVSFPIRAKVGTEFSYKKGKYKVINASEVSYQGITSAKTKKVQIPQTVLLGNKHFKVTKIADKALKNTKITSVVIGSQVKSIGKSSMEGCKELKQVVIGRNVSKIGKRSFGNCKKLKTITIYTSKLKSKNVGSNAFKGIYVKARVEVPEGKVKEYKKWLKSKGAGTKIKVVEKS